MKPKKLRRRLRRAERELARLRALRVGITAFTASQGSRILLDTTLGELLDAEELPTPLAGVAARSPNVYLGPWRLV